MKYKSNIDVEIELNSLENLKKLKTFMEVNNLERPNYSQLGREFGVDRRTVKKYYEGNLKIERKTRVSKLDKYFETIESLLSTDSLRKFYYKSHLYRFMQREHNMKCSRSNFNHYILKHQSFADYFKEKRKVNAVKSEKPFGKQGQFDWKEKIKFTYSDKTTETINVASLVLSASRLKIWRIYPFTKQEYLFDFLSNTFEKIGGVPEEILIDNASTMMDVARTEKSKGKVNVKFQQLADDFNFEIKPCIRARPNTKAKVENPMRIIDEIMNYNGEVKDIVELQEKLDIITNEANMRVCQSTDLPPILVFKKEKEHLLPLPSDKVCSSYKIKFKDVVLNTNSLFEYDKNFYSAPPELIGKTISIHKIENQLYVYYNRKLITMHQKSEKKVNYHSDHHLKIVEETFPKKENIEEFAKDHIKEMEKFNEQLSESM